MDKQAMLLLLLAALNFAQTEVNVKYFVEGGNMVLEPSVSERITNILWKHNYNLLAEWVENEVELTYYGPFVGRTTLDVTTGRLEIRNMTKADVGFYKLEINSKVHGESYDAKAIKKVPKPSVLIQPVACTSESASCILICEGCTKEGTPKDTREAEPIIYSWRRDGGEWRVLEGNCTIDEDTTSHIKTFSCRMKNPVSI